MDPRILVLGVLAFGSLAFAGGAAAVDLDANIGGVAVLALLGLCSIGAMLNIKLGSASSEEKNLLDVSPEEKKELTIRPPYPYQGHSDEKFVPQPAVRSAPSNSNEVETDIEEGRGNDGDTTSVDLAKETL
eukprot:augustus_masked-scaffold_83-processed-gene-0.8-mRNA-1 protein AED:1.00 eAED:1.00 QI:0/-1/0/0/-1/1/1/0/130